jgi:predicted DCC family thiol-disulfide oxidoreductase YuxK
MNAVATGQQKIILFDGVCNLCNGSVRFVLENERQPIFRFAWIQSRAGEELLKSCGLPSDYRQAVVLIDSDRVYLGSTAALKIGQQLKFPWKLLSSVGLMVPRLLRDWVYDQIARNRYRLFGKRDICMIPTGELRERFL